MPAAKVLRRQKIKRRVRKNIFGTAAKPRLSVFRSNKQIYGQIIDDENGVTLCAATSRVAEIENAKETKSQKAFMTGKALGEKAAANGIEEVIFDRNGYLYHGRVKNFADGVREGGLKL